MCGRCIQGEDARSLQTCKSRNVRGVNFFHLTELFGKDVSGIEDVGGVE